MASMKQALGGKYLKAGVDIMEDDMVSVTVRAADVEEMGNGDMCTVLYFHEDVAVGGRNKGYVANKGITASLIKWFGDDTDNLVDARLLLFSVESNDGKGGVVAGLRVRQAPAQSDTMTKAVQDAGEVNF